MQIDYSYMPCYPIIIELVWDTQYSWDTWISQYRADMNDYYKRGFENGYQWVVKPYSRGGCARVIMHHELATPTPIGLYKKFNRIQHQFNIKTKQGLFKSPCFSSKIWQVSFYIQLKISNLSVSEELWVPLSLLFLCLSNLELGKTEQLNEIARSALFDEASKYTTNLQKAQNWQLEVAPSWTSWPHADF